MASDKPQNKAQEAEVGVPVDSASDDENGSSPQCTRTSSDLAPPSPFTLYPLVMVAGFIFGWALNKGRVFEPGNIFEQMIFQKWIMFKMFFMAVASSQVALSILSLLPVTRPYFDAAVAEYHTCCRRGLAPTFLGAFILGVGMSVAGSCPGNVFVQLGANVQWAWLALLGGLTGGLAYALVEPFVAAHILPRGYVLGDQTFLHQKLGRPFHVLALAMATAITVVVIILEVVVPWRSELEYVPAYEGSNLFTTFAWPPSVAGLLLGFVQVAIVLAVRDTAGGSSSFMTVLANLIPPALGRKSAYLFKYRRGHGNLWQLVFVCCGLLGSLASSGASQSLGFLSNPYLVAPWRFFVGGVLMVFGARMAGGCTSGHGISGLGLLNLNSFAAVPGMFAGAILTAVIIHFAE